MDKLQSLLDLFQPLLELIQVALSWVFDQLLSLAVFTTGITLLFNGIANRRQAAALRLDRQKEAVSKVVAKAKEIIPVLSKRDRHKEYRSPAFHAFQVEVRRERYLLPPEVIKPLEDFDNACKESLTGSDWEYKPLRLNETYQALEKAANAFLKKRKP